MERKQPNKWFFVETFSRYYLYDVKIEIEDILFYVTNMVYMSFIGTYNFRKVLISSS